MPVLIKLEISDGLFTVGKPRINRYYKDVDRFHELPLELKGKQIFANLLRDIGMINHIFKDIGHEDCGKTAMLNLGNMYFGSLKPIEEPKNSMEEFYNELVKNLASNNHQEWAEFIKTKFKSYSDLLVYETE